MRGCAPPRWLPYRTSALSNPAVNRSTDIPANRVPPAQHLRTFGAQVFSLYRGVAVPLVGGALETGISYSVRARSAAPRPLVRGPLPGTRRRQHLHAGLQGGEDTGETQLRRARLRGRCTPTCCTGSMCARPAPARPPKVAAACLAPNWAPPGARSAPRGRRQADAQCPDLGTVAVSAATAGFVLSGLLSPFELVKARPRRSPALYRLRVPCLC